ncbi:MAG: hypothetical protein AB7F98_03310 [Novosphingobium sp.]
MAFAASLGMAMSINVALPSVATAQSASDTAKVCQANYEAFGYDSVGDCVSANRTFPVRICQQAKNDGIFPIDVTNPDGTVQTLKNQGQCVSWLRGLLS